MKIILNNLLVCFLSFPLLICTSNIAANEHDIDKSTADNSIPLKQTITLEAGGVYATKAPNSDVYSIAKVITIGKSLIALRYYKEDFKQLPQRINTQLLTVFLRMYVTTSDDFTRQKPKKIGQELVSKEELTVYQQTN